MKIDSLCPLIQVFDMSASLKFYGDMLGFKIHQRAGNPGRLDWVWLKLGDIDLMLNTAYEEECQPEKADSERVSAHADTAFYLGAPDIDDVYHTLVSKGLKIDAPINTPYGMRQLHLLDPDGYSICFQWPYENIS